MCDNSESRCFFLDVVIVAHPTDRLLGYISKKLACLVHSHFDLAVLTNRCLAYMSAENVGHQLRAVAESEYRNAHLKQFLATCSSTFLINAVRTSG